MTNSEMLDDDDFLIEFEEMDDDGSEYEDEQPDPCPICGELETEWESGLCARCDTLFNSAAIAQVLGVSCD